MNSPDPNVPDAAVLAGWLSEMMAAGHEQQADVLGRLRLATHWLRSQATCNTCEPSQLAGLLRLIRGAPASGRHAVATVVEAGAPAALASLAPQLLTPLQAPSATSTVPGAGVASHPARGQVGQPSSNVLLPTILSQALGNLAMSGQEGAHHVWASCYPAALSLLLSHPHVKVWEPCTMALYACCRADAARSKHLCVAPSQASEAPLWALMLSRAVVKESPASAPSKHGDTVCSEWVQLLVGCVAFKHGLLQELLACLPAQEGALHTIHSAAHGTGSVHTSSTNSTPSVPNLAPTGDGAQQQPQQQLSQQPQLVHEQPQQQHVQHELSWCHLTPVLLHILAHELEAMVVGSTTAGAHSSSPDSAHAASAHTGSAQPASDSCARGTGDIGAKLGDMAVGSTTAGTHDSSPSASIMQHAGSQHGASQHCDSNGASALGGAALKCANEGQPWQRTLRCLMRVVRRAASQSRHGCAPGGACSGVLPDGATAPPAQQPSNQAQLARHVLEAGLEVLKCLALREDRGMSICGGGDPVEYLCEQEGLLLHLLGMLHTLQPIQNLGRKASSAAAAASQNENTAIPGQQCQQLHHQQHLHSQHEQQQEQQQQRPQQQQSQQQQQQQQQQQHGTARCPLYTQPAYTHYAPVIPPYLGYRGDVLAVLANAMSARPSVAEALAQQEGAVELVLAQCQLDDLSPLAREWGLWAVRNLCAGSLTAQQRIKQLEPVAPVDSPELRALGMRLEMDHQTGKLKVVKTNEPPQF